MTLTEPVAAVARGVALPRVGAWTRHAIVLPVLALAAVLDTWALSQNGYANLYYSAAVRSMLGSWHRFFFVAADPGGLITVDKPPLGLWLQAASARLFGFDPLSLLLPQAIAAILTVLALYLIVARRLGRVAGLVSAVALAVFPSFVAVARDNNLDALLILLMVLACGAALRAIESDRLGWLLACAALVAMAFNVKALAALLVVPGICAGYVVCAPGSLRRRLVRLAAAGVVLLVLSSAWLALVDATPESQRPFVGGSRNNSELGVTFGYNGIGRLGGQLGGPGSLPSVFVAPSQGVRATGAGTGGGAAVPAHAAPAPHVAPAVKGTIGDEVVPFGLGPGPLRLFQHGLDDQGAWLLPLALAGLLALGLTRPACGDPRLAVLLVLGGFLLTEAAVLSFSRGIVHPYYVSALGPGLAAMIGAGAASLPRLDRRRRTVLGALAVACTAALQAHLLHSDHYLKVWMFALIGLALLSLIALALRPRRALSTLAVALVALLVAPTAFSATLWRRPIDGTFPAAGPRTAGGNGGAGVSEAVLTSDQALIGYLLSHRPGTRYQLLTEASLTADTPILLGLRAAALGGYGGVDPALDGPGLGRLIARGEARYVLIGGAYDYLGGNRASLAAERVCPQIAPALWAGPRPAVAAGFYLLDCGGRAAALERQTRR